MEIQKGHDGVAVVPQKGGFVNLLFVCLAAVLFDRPYVSISQQILNSHIKYYYVNSK